MTLFPTRSHPEVLGVTTSTSLSEGPNSTHNNFFPSSSESPGWSWTHTFCFHMLFSLMLLAPSVLWPSYRLVYCVQQCDLTPYACLPTLFVGRCTLYFVFVYHIHASPAPSAQLGWKDNHKDRCCLGLNHSFQWQWLWNRVFEPILWALPLFAPVWWLLSCPLIQRKPLLYQTCPEIATGILGWM